MFVSAHPHFLMGVFPCIPIYGVTLPFIVISTNRLSRPIHSKHFQDLTSTKSNKTLGKSGCFGHKSAGFLHPQHVFFTPKIATLLRAKSPFSRPPRRARCWVSRSPWWPGRCERWSLHLKNSWGVHHRKWWDFMGFHGWCFLGKSSYLDGWWVLSLKVQFPADVPGK